MPNLAQLEQQVESALKLAQRMLEGYRENQDEAAATSQVISRLTAIAQEINQQPNPSEAQIDSLSRRIRTEIAELERLNYSED